jgi:hypothetical protein
LAPISCVHTLDFLDHVDDEQNNDVVH